MHSILKKIIAAKKAEVRREKATLPLELLKKEIEKAKAGRNFKKAISGSSLKLIAEIKRASPSKGEIVKNFEPEHFAAAYKKGRADAVSVLTEKIFFKGDVSYIRRVKKIVRVPVLRKDFILDDYQLYGAKYYGADAVLLICAILPFAKLKKFIRIVKALKMHALVEVHTRKEIQDALRADARIIGINNRDLNTFKVDLKTTERLIKLIPAGIVIVSESGIKTVKDMLFLKKQGVNAVLIGETLMRSRNIPKKIDKLLCR